MHSNELISAWIIHDGGGGFLIRRNIFANFSFRVLHPTFLFLFNLSHHFAIHWSYLAGEMWKALADSLKMNCDTNSALPSLSSRRDLFVTELNSLNVDE